RPWRDSSGSWMNSLPLPRNFLTSSRSGSPWGGGCSGSLIHGYINCTQVMTCAAAAPGLFWAYPVSFPKGSGGTEIGCARRRDDNEKDGHYLRARREETRRRLLASG